MIAYLAMLSATRPVVCLPAAVGTVEAAREDRRRLGIRLNTGCSPDSTGVVQCNPEAMRATTEAKLRSQGLLDPRGSLSMTAYAMARNIGSEAGDGATGAEKLAMGETLVTRAREQGIGMLQLMTRNGKFAKQRGSNPAVSSARDPKWEDLVAAKLVLAGKTDDMTRGATHYFAPKDQDALFRNGRVSKNRLMLYDNWTSGGDLLAWVGYVPGIDIERQFFFRRLPKTAEGRAQHARMKPIGRRALTSPMPEGVLDADVCETAPLLAGRIGTTIMGLVGLPALLFLRYGDSA